MKLRFATGSMLVLALGTAACGGTPDGGARKGHIQGQMADYEIDGVNLNVYCSRDKGIEGPR